MTLRGLPAAVLLAQMLGCGAPGTGVSDTGTGSDTGLQSEGGGTTEIAVNPTEAASDAGTGDATGASDTGESGTSTGSTGEAGTSTGTTGEIEISAGATDDSGTTTGDTDPDSTGGECLPICMGEPDPYVDCLISFDPAPATLEAGGFNYDALPGVVLGPPEGSAGVVALGCGGEIVLGLGEPFIVDGVGPDFIVFENPFNVSFPEPGLVEVSADGCEWSSFPCDPVSLAGCAGKSVTKALPNSGLDPTDPDVAGGDPFDLADVAVEQARYIRIVDVSEAYWSAMDQSYCDPGQGGKGGFDLDAIAVVNGSE